MVTSARDPEQPRATVQGNADARAMGRDGVWSRIPMLWKDVEAGASNRDTGPVEPDCGLLAGSR